MRRTAPLAVGLLLFGYAALAQGPVSGPVAYGDMGETQAALRDAVAGRAAAEARSQRLEAQAQAAESEVARTAAQTAALAARVQQAEAGIAAANARATLIAAERARLGAELGRQQRPIVSLTAALQQFSRRPVMLSLLRPGAIKDVVYLRAVMATAVPQVTSRTAGLRRRIDRVGQLAAEAAQAGEVLRSEQAALAARRNELAALESRQRLAAREVGSQANREAERALALAEQARDLDGLMGEMQRDAALRQRLAALSGPVLRPGSGRGGDAAEAAVAPLAEVAAGPPSPFTLPVTGRTVAGFGSVVQGALSKGVTLAPAANAQVVAPAAGRVAYSGPYRGYGQIVIVEHANGWTSLVTGLARSDVAVGQELLGGAPIGVAGPGRPTITLELREGGTPVNPLDHVR